MRVRGIYSCICPLHGLAHLVTWEREAYLSVIFQFMTQLESLFFITMSTQQIKKEYISWRFVCPSVLDALCYSSCSISKNNFLM